MHMKTNARNAKSRFTTGTSRTSSWPRSVALEMAIESQAIGRRIAELRNQAHLTQPVVAERVGVSLRAYQKWEAGKTRPNWTNLEHLAEVFGVKEDEIIGDATLDDEASQLSRMENKLDWIMDALDHSEIDGVPPPPPSLASEDDEPKSPSRARSGSLGRSKPHSSTSS